MLQNLFNPQFEIEEEQELEEVSIEEQKQVWGGFNDATDGAANAAAGFATAAGAPVAGAAIGVGYGSAKVGWWLGNNAVPDSVIEAGADVYGNIAY